METQYPTDGGTTPLIMDDLCRGCPLAFSNGTIHGYNIRIYQFSHT
jgi:hypothetical protein